MDSMTHPHTGLDAAQLSQLETRAKRLAQQEVGAGLIPSTTLKAYLYFHVVEEPFAIDLECVQELIPLSQLLPVPGVPTHVLGVSRIRGRVVAFIDLRRYFTPLDTQHADSDLALLIEHKGIEFGLLCASVSGVRELDNAQILAPPKNLSSSRASCAVGIDSDGTLVLNVEALLAQSSFRVTFEDAEEHQ